jgi:phosphoglycolate phosphatase
LPFDLFVFDLDGTLVDSLPDIAGALNAALAEDGLAALDLGVVRGLVGEGVQRLADKALATLGVVADAQRAQALAAAVVRRYAEHPCVATRLYEGVEQTLTTLRGRGHRLACFTNKPGGVARALLAALGIERLLDAVIGDGDGFPRKPAPEGLTDLRLRLGHRALMVGDGLPDLAVARAAGVPSAGVTWGYTDEARLAAEHPKYLVRRPEDLLAL